MASEIRGHLVQPWAALGSKSPDATKGPGRGGEGLSPFAKRDPWGETGRIARSTLCLRAQEMSNE